MRCCLALFAVVLIGSAGLDLPARGESPSEAGLAIGAQAPEFALKDQNGQEVTLKALLEKGPVAVIFHRSAEW